MCFCDRHTVVLKTFRVNDLSFETTDQGKVEIPSYAIEIELPDPTGT